MPTHNIDHNNEIDLAQLLQNLWKGRVALLVFFLVGVVLSAIYVLTTKEQWTSVAYLSPPRLEQINAYLDQRRAMARVTGNEPIASNALSSSLFSTFIKEVAISKNQLAYLSKTEYYKQQKTDDPVANHRLLLDLARQLHIEAPGKDEIAPHYKLTFSADTTEQAQHVLTGYLNWANDISFYLVDEGFNDLLNAQILSHQTELENIDFKLTTDRQYNIESLENALHTARLAGIKDYVVARQTEGATVIELSDSKRLFMLGEKYLNAELETRQNTPVIYPPNYYKIKRELVQLKPLRDYKVEATSYFLQQAPTLPLSRDGFGPTLIVILGGTLGGMLGVFWLLASEAFRREDSATAPWRPLPPSDESARETSPRASHRTVGVASASYSNPSA
ncbi:Wzz/FepE/Etk N-terminal domain-containing protein [Castellaniella sp. FW104-16D08]|uniref:LPS O-antigen chain length determinant protein WzzB n=1 Tax=unclassified Castellaniella TaxID=2617606 RepID=UPI003315F574